MKISSFIHLAIDCQWNQWINGTCSKVCGTGTRVNNRTIKVQDQFGGYTCEGPSYEIEICNTHPCPGNYFTINLDHKESLKILFSNQQHSML